MKTQLSVLLCLCIISLGFSQDQLWQRVDSQKNLGIFTNQTDLPTKTVFTLDQETMYKALSKASLQKKGVVSNVIIPFPNADGTLENYNIYENPIMEPEFAAKYPNIKSYKGYSTTTAGVISFSISPKGVQSIRLGHGSSVFIEILSEKNSTYTVSNDMKNIAVSQNFGHRHEHEESPIHITNHQKSATDLQNNDDGKLRTYRLAVSATYEYTQFHKEEETEEEKIKERAIAAINATITTVNALYKQEVGVQFMLVDNEEIVYTEIDDPYNQLDDFDIFENQIQNVIDTNIGSDNYDIGHLFSKRTGPLQRLSFGEIKSLCQQGSKAKGFSCIIEPVGELFDINIVSHELAHQLGANHTFSYREEISLNGESTGAQMEPGSGSTIMGYNLATDVPKNQIVQASPGTYFHAYSIHQMRENITNPENCRGIIADTNNTPPIVDAGPDYIIPKGTPFVLTATATDAEGDALSYCWEQIDAEDFIPDNSVYGPLFRSLLPKNEVNTRNFPSLFDPLHQKWEKLPNKSGQLNFRCTVKDGQSNNGDSMKITVTDQAGPFKVTQPTNTTTWPTGTEQTITWDVANTNGNAINAATVDILIANKGFIEQFFFKELATGVPNNGSYTFTVPEDLNFSKIARVMVKGSDNIFYALSENFEIGSLEEIGAPRDLKIYNRFTTTVELAWKMNLTAITNTQVKYEVFQNDEPIDTIVRVPIGLTYNVPDLESDETYSFYIKAIIGDEEIKSDPSNTITVTTSPSSVTDGSQCIGGVISSTSNSGFLNEGFPFIDGFSGFSNRFDKWTNSRLNDRTEFGRVFNWRVERTSTSDLTGPKEPAEGSTFAELRSFNITTNKTAYLYSKCFYITANSLDPEFSFQYHMFGSGMGSLTLQLSDDNGISWLDIWQKSGDQGNSWKEETILLNDYIQNGEYRGKQVRFRFKGVIGETNLSDIAIDDVRFIVSNPEPETCEEVALHMLYDAYSEEIKWEIIDNEDIVIASGSSYDGQGPLTSLYIYNCLIPGEYTFVLYDTGKDGFYTPGSYTLTNLETEEVIVSEAAFNGPSSSTKFTIGPKKPESPTNLKEDSKTDRSVALAWDKPDTPPHQYRIYQGISAGELEFVSVVGGASEFALIENLEPNTTYFFYITATNSIGDESEPSNIVEVTTSAPIARPEPPSNLISTPESLEISLEWDRSPSSNVRYNIYQNDVLVQRTRFTFAFIQDLNPNTEYTFYVTAINTEGGESEPSNSTTATPLPAALKSNVSTITIIPNPVEDSNHVTVVSSQHIVSYAVYDIAGREVRSTTPLPDTKTISLTGIENGMYIVKLQDDKGKTFNQSLIIN
ncbi:reprolysin-like metallopeptidase [Aquimarina megaterium]|uniref:reprolysin-like metallopeptidase n=1 Tax=Aquimarina megaterium TaxID=1443666 RepID=UPI00046FDA38|nr:zinc-dependent metalloprotease family protein [Aquimarina megaterium]